MAVHLIQLTAISHLSSEILGLEVNVVRERMLDMDDMSRSAMQNGRGSGSQVHVPAGEVVAQNSMKRRNFLVYSSFAASALVVPHESMLQFWQRRAFVTDLIRRFAGGPSLSDPRSGLPLNDYQHVMSLWQGLLSELVMRYAAVDNDRLELAISEVEERRGIWDGFWEPMDQVVQQAILDTGIRGALVLCDLLGPSSEAGAAPESLPRQRLFLLNGQPVTQEDRLRWRKLLSQQSDFIEQMQQLGP